MTFGEDKRGVGVVPRFPLVPLIPSNPCCSGSNLCLFPSPAAEMVRSPFETRSDSFYFVDNRLVMHNHAEYAYDA